MKKGGRKQHFRRSNGDGSVFQRKDGLWCGYVTLGFDDHGKQKKQYVYGKTKSEVTAKLSNISGQVKSLAYKDIKDKTVGELMMDWLMTFKKSSVTSRTFEGNIRNYKLHIEPLIGKLKIDELDVISVQKTINTLLDSGYNISTAKKIKFLINQFCEFAIDSKWLLINPTTKIKIRAKDKRNSERRLYKALPPEERERFINALNNDPSNFLKPLCYVMMFAGLRAGEAIALKWRNIDFERKMIKIEQAITQEAKFDESGNVQERITVVGDTKTACSVREIPATDIVLNELKDWKIKQHERSVEVGVDLTSKNAYVFANDNGDVRTYSGSRVIFQRFIKRNHLSDLDLHFHGLRHTFSNMLFELNENPKVIQQLLGHKDVKTTITIYNNVNSEYVRESTNRLNDMLNENEKLRKAKLEQGKKLTEKSIDELSDDEFNEMLKRMMQERQTRKQQKDQDLEM